MRTKNLVKFLICCIGILSSVSLGRCAPASMVYGTFSPEDAQPVFHSYIRPATIWIPSFMAHKGLEVSTATLEEEFKLLKSGNKIKPIEAVSHLALQFWQPDTHGNVDFDKGLLNDYSPSRGPQGNREWAEEQVRELVKWGHKNNVRVMLCVYNPKKVEGSSKGDKHSKDEDISQWDWPLARSAFGANRATFINSLITEMNRFGLDGIDIDLEGEKIYQPEDSDSERAEDVDRRSYVDFIIQLAAALNTTPKGMGPTREELRDTPQEKKLKHLTADSLVADDHGPNRHWWKEILPWVEGLNGMGYQDSGRKTSQDQPRRDRPYDYSTLKFFARPNTHKLQIGVPSSLPDWQDDPAQAQIEWIKDNKTGLAIWDSQMGAWVKDSSGVIRYSPVGAWHTYAIWKTIQDIRDGR
jgi:hypothetical protein